MNIRPEYVLPLERGDRRDAVAVLADTLLAVEPGVTDDRDLQLRDPCLENTLGHVRLEDPHRARDLVDGRGALALVAVLVAPLPAPGFGFLVVPPHAMVELAGQAPDDGLVARVRPAEAAGGETAEVALGADHHDRLVHVPRLDGGRDAAGGAPVHEDVGLAKLGSRGVCGGPLPVLVVRVRLAHDRGDAPGERRFTGGDIGRLARIAREVVDLDRRRG